MRRLQIALTSAAVCIAIGACGVPSGDDTFQRIEDADVPLNLASPSTLPTTTTTTTIALPPETTTTVPEILPETELDPVSLYFLAGDELRPVRREVETGFANLELIGLLASGPDPETTPGLQTLVPDGLVNEIRIRRGTATVDIDESIYRRVSASDRTSLFAQLVLTLTSSASNVGAVTFTFDDVADNVPTQNNLLRPIVAFEDYARLIANAIVVEPPPTTTTTTVPPTTVPETTLPAEAEADAVVDSTTTTPLAEPTTAPPTTVG